MELLFKTAIAVAVIVAVIAGFFLYYEIMGQGQSVTTPQQAIALIESDIRQHTPSAQVTVLNVSNSTVHSESWDITVRIIYNQSSACPSVTTEEFDNVPTAGLLATPTTIVYSQYLNGTCIVNLNTGPALQENIIGLPSIAIALPYNRSFGPLVSFIGMNGYGNVRAYAGYISPSAANGIAAASGSNMTFNSSSQFWLVNYTSGTTGRTLHLVMGTSGNILLDYTS